MSETPSAAPPGLGQSNAPLGNALKSFAPQRSTGLKLLLVCGLALLMAIPALFVYGVVKERTVGAEQALSEVSARVGGEQSVLGPVLAVPYARTPDETKPDRQIYGVALAYAITGEAIADVSVEERKRGIYVTPVFDGSIKFDAIFDPAALHNAIPVDATPVWSDARLYLGVSDNRGVKDAIAATVNGRKIEIEPAPFIYSGDASYQPVPRSNVALAGGVIPNLQSTTQPLKISASIRLTGARRLAIGPFAKDTTVKMQSNWEDPSFTGGVLPDTHNASEDSVKGFEATWRVPYIARGIVGAGPRLNLADVTNYNSRDMAVRFMRDANPYQSVERALKYAAMFIGFVFLAYFLFEITSGARAHPAQYVLVGLAQTIFYLLLLAFAERIGFDAAFLIAAAMTVAITSGYAMSVFRSRLYGLRSVGVLSGIYALIYMLLRAQENALITGALASFSVIAVTMYMTRNIDWYGDSRLAAA